MTSLKELPAQINSDSYDPKITLNISGSRMVICENLLDKYPNTLLGCKKLRYLNYDKLKDEYFYDRSACAFEGILYFYQSNGRIVVPAFVHVEIFYEELKYYGLVDYIAKDPKCDEAILYVAFSDLFTQIHESDSDDKNLLVKKLKKKFFKIKFFNESTEDDDDDENSETNVFKNNFLYDLLERPNNSYLGRLLVLIFVLAVFVSVTFMCLETINFNDNFINDYFSNDERKRFFFLIEVICNSIFTFEFILRFIASPFRVKFMRKFSNIIDIIAIFPFWITIILRNTITEDSSLAGFSNLYILRILRLTRVLRVLKLSRHIKSINIMGRILYECFYEITLLLTFLGMNIIIFSSLMYYIEMNALGNESPFISIPHSFWWAVISFTTVGYGDLIPISPSGKFFGSIFILFGILIALLPTPILSCKFEGIYKKLNLVAKPVSKEKGKKNY